jgi:hypothetical protein
MTKLTYTKPAEFRVQLNDPIGGAFRAFSMEHACRYHAAQHFDREFDRLARVTARRAADEFGIGRPAAVRWFSEFHYDDPDKVTLSGVAFPYYGAIYLNTGLKTFDDVRFTAAHETAHLAGAAYDSEEAADRFAARFVAERGGQGRRPAGDVLWRGAGAGWRELVVG